MASGPRPPEIGGPDSPSPPSGPPPRSTRSPRLARPTRPARREAWRDPRVAAEYEELRFRSAFGRLKHGRDARLVVRLLGGRPRRVLDLPTGTARLVPPLRAAGHRVLAADVSLPMLSAHPERMHLADAFLVGDAGRLPLRDGAVDAVVSLRFLHHYEGTADRRRFLAEMGRVSSGPVVGEVRYRGTLKQALRWLRSRFGIRRRYRPSVGRREIAAELAAAGLELERLVPVSRLFSDKALFVARAPLE